MNTPDLSTAKWRKSSYTSDTGGQCVELADLSAVVAVRDSKHPDGPVLAFGRTAFGRLTREIHAGHHDL